MRAFKGKLRIFGKIISRCVKSGCVAAKRARAVWQASAKAAAIRIILRTAAKVYAIL